MSTTPTRLQTANRLVFLLRWATSVDPALPVPWARGRALAWLRRVGRLSGSGLRPLERLLTAYLTFVMVGEVAL